MASEWTIDTLLEHIRAVADERQQALALLASDINKRFDTTNEWRQTYGDMLNTMLPRSEGEQRMSRLQEQVSAIQQAPFVSRNALDLVEGSLRKEIDATHTTVVGMESEVRSLRDSYFESKANTDQRFHQVNEFRSAMGDQQKTYLPAATWEAGHEMIRSAVEAQRIALLEHVGQDTQWQGELRSSIQSLQARMIGATAAVAAIMAVVVALVAILRINA